MPQALAIGVPYDLFWHLTPRKLGAFYKAHSLRNKMDDEKMWIMGQYMMSAMSVVVGQAIAGSKNNATYLKEPILHHSMDNAELSQEEIDSREIEKMLMAERQWQTRHALSNLPETELK